MLFKTPILDYMQGGQCRRLGYDFQCTCPSDRDGKLCELERGDACASNPCRNGGSCRKSPDSLSFFCLCRAGYRGNHCEAATDSCRPNPCLYGGLCLGEKPGFVHCPSKINQAFFRIIKNIKFFDLLVIN